MFIGWRPKSQWPLSSTRLGIRCRLLSFLHTAAALLWAGPLSERLTSGMCTNWEKSTACRFLVRHPSNVIMRIVFDNQLRVSKGSCHGRKCSNFRCSAYGLLTSESVIQVFCKAAPEPSDYRILLATGIFNQNGSSICIIWEAQEIGVFDVNFLSI